MKTLAFIIALFSYFETVFPQTGSVFSKDTACQKSIVFKFINKPELQICKMNLFSKELQTTPFIYKTIYSNEFSKNVNESMYGVTPGEALFVITTNLLLHGINTFFFSEEYKKERRPIPYLQDVK